MIGIIIYGCVISLNCLKEKESKKLEEKEK